VVAVSLKNAFGFGGGTSLAQVGVPTPYRPVAFTTESSYQEDRPTPFPSNFVSAPSKASPMDFDAVAARLTHLQSGGFVQAPQPMGDLSGALTAAESQAAGGEPAAAAVTLDALEVELATYRDAGVESWAVDDLVARIRMLARRMRLIEEGLVEAP
jgi:hypothetical protein